MSIDDGRGELTLKELCEESGVSERTVRYYMQQGLLAPAARSGPGVRYPASQLSRLRLIRRWQDEYLPLEQIRKLLSELPDAEAERLTSDRPPPAGAKSATGETRSTAADYVARVLGRDPLARPARAATPAPGGEPQRSHWERYALTEDLELHVRRPLSHAMNRRVEALLAEARKLLTPDQEKPR
ncbi:MAG: MerR family transcriptional regulator [Deltaproteobacteria bacterium]|nr:MerR family transcriptional regulator [Deltaproteobacteria bacterium]